MLEFKIKYYPEVGYIVRVFYDGFEKRFVGYVKNIYEISEIIKNETERYEQEKEKSVKEKNN